MELILQFVFCLKFLATVIAVEYHHVGCFSHSFSRDTLGKIHSTDPLLTPRRCLARCSRDSFPYFILKDGNVCSCDRDVSNITKYNRSEECNSLCVGDSDSVCGGKNAVDVFKVNYCKFLQSPLDGYVNQTTSEALFWCSDGYYLQGLDVIHCDLSTSQWDGPTDPKCLEHSQISVFAASSASSTFPMTQKYAKRWTLEVKLLEIISSWERVTILALSFVTTVLLVSCVVITSKYALLKKSTTYRLQGERMTAGYGSDNDIALTSLPHSLVGPTRRSSTDLRGTSFSTHEMRYCTNMDDHSTACTPNYVGMTSQRIDLDHENGDFCQTISLNDRQHVYSRVLTWQH